MLKMNRVLQSKTKRNSSRPTTPTIKKEAERMVEFKPAEAKPCQANLILSKSSHIVVPIILTPFEHTHSFDEGAKATAILQPCGRLKCTSEMRKSFLENYPKSPHIYTVTTDSHPLNLRALFKELYYSREEQYALILSYKCTFTNVGSCLLFPLSQKRGVLVKKQSFLPELSGPLAAYRTVLGQLEQTAQSDHFELIAKNFYSYLDHKSTKIESVFDKVTGLLKILQIQRKSLLEFMTHSSPAHVLPRIFPIIGRLVLLLELNHDKFMEEVISQTRRVLMLLSELPDKSTDKAFQLRAFMDEELYPRYNLKSENTLRAMYGTSINLYYPGDTDESGSSEDESISEEKLDQNENIWIDDDVFSELGSLGYSVDTSIPKPAFSSIGDDRRRGSITEGNSRGRRFEGSSQVMKFKVKNGDSGSSRVRKQSVSKGRSSSKKAPKTPKKKIPKTPKKTTKRYSMKNTPLKRQNELRTKRHKNFRMKANQRIIGVIEETRTAEDDSVPAESRTLEDSSNEVAETPQKNNFYRTTSNGSIGTGIKKSLSEVFSNKLTVKSEAPTYDEGVSLTEIRMSLNTIRRTVTPLLSRRFDPSKLHARDPAPPSYNPTLPAFMTENWLHQAATAFVPQSPRKTPQKDLQTYRPGSAQKSNMFMSSPVQNRKLESLRSRSSLLFEKRPSVDDLPASGNAGGFAVPGITADSPLKNARINRAAEWVRSQGSLVMTPGKRKEPIRSTDSSSSITQDVSRTNHESSEVVIPSSQAFFHPKSQHHMLKSCSKKRRIERFSTVSTFDGSTGIPDAILTNDELVSESSENDELDRLEVDQQFRKSDNNASKNPTPTISGPDTTTPEARYAKKTPTSGRTQESLSPAALRELTSSKILTPGSLRRPSKDPLQQQNQASQARRLTYGQTKSSVDAPVFGGCSELSLLEATASSPENEDTVHTTLGISSQFTLEPDENARSGRELMSRVTDEEIGGIFHNEESNHAGMYYVDTLRRFKSDDQ